MSELPTKGAAIKLERREPTSGYDTPAELAMQPCVSVIPVAIDLFRHGVAGHIATAGHCLDNASISTAGKEFAMPGHAREPFGRYVSNGPGRRLENVCTQQ